MKINKIKIKNIKSFKEETEIKFNNDFNILIGSNGSGKSNLLDILTIMIRHYFLKPYKIEELNNTNSGAYKNISLENNIFGSIENVLEKFYGDNSESIIDIEFCIKKEDIANMQAIQQNIELLDKELKSYKTKPNISKIKNWKIEFLKENDILTYSIKEYKLISSKNDKEKYFLEYLNLFELILILTKEFNEIKLNTNYLFFSPYRIANTNNLQANLSSQNFYQVFKTLTNATSKKTSSLIKLATIYFAEKRRKFENFAENKGYKSLWKSDEEVKLVTKYLNKLGYDWELELIDANKNIYEISLTSNNKKFTINQASSGEKEIINFLFGIFAFNIQNGIIIIDEPEVHLHPKWQKILLELFIEMSSVTHNQFIISTHSSIFINDKSYNHVFRIYKNNSISNCIVLKDIEELSIKDILHIVNSTNNEKIFFSDAVILVEGITDRLIFQKILNEKLNENIIFEVIEIKGKNNINKFKYFLEQLKIPNYFIADLDYINEIGDENIKSLFKTNNQKVLDDVIKNKKSKDGDDLVEKIELALKENNCKYIKDKWEYIKSFRRKLKKDLTQDEQKLLIEFIIEKQKENIYLLEYGDIEDYFPKELKSKNLDNVLALLENNNYEKWKLAEEYKELEKIIEDILNKYKGRI